MFVSTYYFSVDSKGRLSIPSSFRDLLREDGQPDVLYLTKAPDQKIIIAYPKNRYDEIIAKITDPATGVANQKVLRGLTGNTAACVIDKQCRIIVPRFLLEYANVNRDVAVVGAGKRVEIWEKKAWEEENKNNQPGSVPASILY